MDTAEISADAKRAALRSILESSRLASADRLQGFLTHIVEEDIAGRGADIRGKTIAQDVYGKDPAQGADPENVVRVDARRIRQILELFYQGEGASDPVRLHLDSGNYRPRFERISTENTRSVWSKSKRFGLPVAFFVGGAAIGAISVNLFMSRPPAIAVVEVAESGQIDRVEHLRRSAIYDKSPSALQAFNLADQARDMIFPIFDRPRQQIVRTVFEHVVDLDPDYYGGYAGASQAQATLAIISPPGAKKDELIATARLNAEKAVALAPDAAWSQSALSWALMAAGSYYEAMRIGRRASLINPEDSHVLDFFGAVALFSGEFETALEISERAFRDEVNGHRSANRNVSGAANFHLGNYATAIERFDRAAEYGNPLSAASLAYVVAALAATGREREAQNKLEELQEAWPNAPIDQMLKGIYRDDTYAGAVVGHLQDLGWRPQR